MTYEHLFVKKEGHIAIVTLNRPDKLNALNGQIRQEMLEACEELRNDDEIRAVIWTGEGRGFCSGVDLTAGGTPEEEAPSRQERPVEKS